MFASHLSFGQVVLDSSLSFCEVLDSADCHVFKDGMASNERQGLSESFFDLNKAVEMRPEENDYEPDWTTL